MEKSTPLNPGQLPFPPKEPTEAQKTLIPSSKHILKQRWLCFVMPPAAIHCRSQPPPDNSSHEVVPGCQLLRRYQVSPAFLQLQCTDTQRALYDNTLRVYIDGCSCTMPKPRFRSNHTVALCATAGGYFDDDERSLMPLRA